MKNRGIFIIVFALISATAKLCPGLTITPTFDTSIANDPNAATLETDINTAINLYASLWADPISLSIEYRYADTLPNGNPLGANSLAHSNYTVFAEPYATYISHLTADAKSANDFQALSNLPPTPLATDILVTSANGRAVGFNTAGGMNSSGVVGTGGTFDGIVTINSSANFQLTRTGGIASNKYDVEHSIEHETDEVMGLGSILPNTTDYTGKVAVKPEDLFRYSAPGTMSLTTSSTASTYFSINGGFTDIASFNQNPNGDYGDWGTSPTPLVQLAFNIPGTQADISSTSPEGVALDVIGYDLLPEPSGIALLALISLAAASRRRHHRM